MEQASKIAKAMVTEFAMFPEVLPYSIKKDHFISQDLRKRIDEQVRRVLAERLEIVKKKLTSRTDQLLKVSDELMKRDTLSAEEVRQIIDFK